MSEDQATPPKGSTAAEAADDPVEEGIDASAEPVHTGDPQVDSVVADVAAMAERPLAEHPVAFEEAHERLRGVLDTPSGDTAAAADDDS